MKYLVAIIAFSLSIASAKATDPVDMVATALVYKSTCGGTKMDAIAGLYIDASGGINNRLFFAQVMLKANEFQQSIKFTKDFCRRMDEAFEQGMNEK